MWAVVEIGKKQYLVEKGTTYKVERLEAKKKEVVLDKVLLFLDGDKLKIGTPYLDNIEVKAEILEEKKGEKVIIYKYKRRKKYRKRIGHRQIYSLLKISEIGVHRPPPKSSEK